MPAKAGLNFGIGINGANQPGPGTGAGLPWQTMYAGRGTAPAHVITGELVALLVLELLLLGWIRLSFARHFGG